LIVLSEGHILARGTAAQLATSEHELVRGFMKSQGAL
jgi:ABC-type transporter Mla maintaining outer membrane lipid asymmetry ATPase subunit MlaF